MPIVEETPYYVADSPLVLLQTHAVCMFLETLITKVNASREYKTLQVTFIMVPLPPSRSRYHFRLETRSSEMVFIEPAFQVPCVARLPLGSHGLI